MVPGCARNLVCGLPVTLEMGADLNSYVTVACFLGAYQHGGFPSRKLHRLHKHLCVGVFSQLLIIQVAYELPGIFRGMILTSTPLRFADDRLQKLLHLDRLALQFKAGWQRLGRDSMLRLFG